MGHSNKKIGFGDETQLSKKNSKFYTQEQLEELKFDALKMHQKNRFDKAVNSYKKLIKYGIKDPEVFLNLYQIYLQQLRFKDAYLIYKRIIRDTNFSYEELTIDFLRSLLKNEKLELTKQIIDESFNENKSNERVISFYSKVLIERNNANLALNVLKKGLEKNPSSITILCNIGYILQSLREYNLAISYYKKALIVKPEDYLVLFNLATCFEEIFDFDSAIDYYKKSLQKNSNNPEAYRALGTIYFNFEKFDLAKIYLEKCILIDKKNSGALNTLMKLSADICEWSNVKKTFKLINNQNLISNNSPFPFLAVEDKPSNHLKRARNASNQRFQKKEKRINSFFNKKKRIGYFSSDFFNHATMHLMNKVFELHDKNTFDIYIYSYGKYQDEITERLKKNVYKFRDVSLLSDDEISRIAIEDNLDVAIDLKGFTRESRFLIFANRVAKIQISYLGYPGTSGADFIDYLIADRTLIPKDYEKFYSEKIIYMPDSYQCNDDTKIISDIKFNRKDFNLPEKSVIYTCFNAAFKITEVEFSLWMDLLKKVEDSHLWLLSTNSLMENNLIKEAKKRGINKNRLTFANKLPLDKHLARHKLGDIFLDTFNYNAHTTASDALWTGMPLITFAGKSFSSRVSASLLKALGLDELICSSKQEYFEKALELGKDPKKLSCLKQKIIENKSTYPLFNTRLFVENYEFELKQVINNHK